MPGGPKRLSAAVLKKRGSPLAAVREREEARDKGRYTDPVPQVRPLPRVLSRAAREWGTALMTTYVFDEVEHRVLVEFLGIWDEVRALQRDVQLNGYSQVDKNGYSRQRPESRALEHARQQFLSYARELKIRTCPNADTGATTTPATARRAAYPPSDYRAPMVLRGGPAGVSR